MKIILLSLLFLPIIYLALRQKKWYLYLFLAFLCVLPEQFSVRVHPSLPLVTGSRLLIMCVFGFWLWDRWKTKRVVLPKSILIFLGVNLIISFVNFRFGFSEINRIFLLFFERVLPIVMLADMIETPEEFDRSVDFLIMGGVALAVIGIVQTVFEYDISTPLHLTQTYTSGSLAPRMGLIRAAGTYNAISFGCYCTMLSLAVIYRLYNTRKIWYSIALALVLTALICTLTRSAWLCLFAVLFLMLLFCRGKLIVRLLPSVGILVALCIIFCFIQPNLKNAFVETGKSSVNTVLEILPDKMAASIVDAFTPDETKPPKATQPQEATEATTEPEETTEPTEPSKPSRFELHEDFGMNGDDPTYTRMAQWTAVRHMAQKGNTLFGLGYNALPEGRIYFFFDRWGGKWESTDFLDVGLVALLAESGLVGAISFLSLLGYMLVYAFRKRDRKNPMDFYHLIIYFIPLFLILNFLAAFMFEDLVWVMIGLFYAWRRVNTQPGTDRDLWTLSLRRRNPAENTTADPEPRQ